MLWGFEAPGRLVARRNASARRFSLGRSVRACAPRAGSREADPRSAPWRRGRRRLEPEAEVASGDRRQPSGRNQPDEALAGLDCVDRAAGGDLRASAADRDGVGRRRLFQSPGIVRIRRRASAPRDRRPRLVRLASAVSRRGSEFLGAQRAWRSAGIRLVPRGDPPSGGAIPHAAQRSGACAHAGEKLRRRWDPARRRRGVGRERCMARARGGSDRPPISPSRIC